LNLNYRPPSSIWALSVLHEAGEQREAREILPRAEEELMKKASVSDDHDKSFACDGFAEMVRVYEALAMPEKVEHWYAETLRLAQSIRTPLYRCEAFLNLVGLEARLGRADKAGEWLLNAISEWRQVSTTNAGMMRVAWIMSAWEGIPDGDARYKHIASLQGVLGRLPDLGDRERWQAYIAASFFDHPARFAELSLQLTSEPGLNTLLMRLRDTKAGLPEAMRRATFEILEKSSRRPLLVFTGQVLGATQALIRHGILDGPTARPVLKNLEATIRNITAV
jgi:hypothetical protein